ncbi:hypothetical protein CICLE_v10017522mg [Citrus x clementina]|uniref:Uncharacterized protein n=1 Tax=Citrus clementina TaxID=85681 RepID=V4UAL9_CITCL|nr:hypothetical protein CICLE_v10017522mg [Citrus x clementina]
MLKCLGNHRGPQLWDNPLEFRPERFLNDGIAIKFDYSSNNFQYLPFHSGRKKCCWGCSRKKKKKKKPLVAIPTPRLPNSELYK